MTHFPSCVVAHNAEVEYFCDRLNLKRFSRFLGFSFAGAFESREGGCEDSLALINCSKKVNSVFTSTQSCLAFSSLSSSYHFSTTSFCSLSTIRGTRTGAKVSQLNFSPIDPLLCQKQRTALKCLLIFHQYRLGLLDFIGFLRGLPV